MLVARSVQPSMPKLSEAARHLVYPSTIERSLFPMVEEKLAAVGVGFDPWQCGFGSISLGLDAFGRFAATVGGVVASIPRQVGKTFTVGHLLIGLCLLFPNLRVIWTSHHLSTTGNTFRSMQGMVRKPKVWQHVESVRLTNGEQQILFTNGSVIMFGARSMGFGRGMDKIDVEVFDEAQILGIKALEDMVPATNQAQNPHGGLLFFIGTPPRPVDDGEAFTAKRKQALEGNADDDMVYVEFSADPEADPDDRSQWSVMNPSYPSRTPLASMLRMRKNMPNEDSWRREAMGVWDDDMGIGGAFGRGLWADCAVDEAPAVTTPSYGVAFSQDGSRCSIAGAMPGEILTHVELIDVGDGMGGLAPLADWLTERNGEGVPRWRKSSGVVIGGSAGAGVLKQLLIDRKVPERRIRVVNTPQYLQACLMLDEEVSQGNVTHLAGEGQAALDDSVSVCGKDKRGGWAAQTVDGDETPLEAVSLALWGSRTSKVKPREGRKAMVFA